MATVTCTSPPSPSVPTSATTLLLLAPLRRSSPRLRFKPSSTAAAAAAASAVSLGRGCRPLPSVSCRAAAGPSPPSSEPPPPSQHGWQERLSKLQDRVRIFFAVLFWMSLFFWASAWDGPNNSGGKKGQRFRKKQK